MKNIIDKIISKNEDIKGIHPAAELFPFPSDEEYTALVEDIKKNGLINPIVIIRDSQLLLD